MKKLISILAMLLITAVALTVSVSAAHSLAKPAVQNTPAATDAAVEKALAARFTNMLNHNYLYDDDFNSDRSVIENSMLALLDHAENDELDQNLVLSFIANLYGRTVDPNAAIYDFLPASPGKFAILPRGYSTISHQVTEMEENEGGYLVQSIMTVQPHDGAAYTIKAQTVFVKNETSSFGYNLVSSNLFPNESAALL